MAKGRNPLLPPDVYIPDAEAHVFHHTLYLYGSMDSEEETYCSPEYHVVSTEDMREFKVHGKSFDGHEVRWTSKEHRKERKSYPVADMDLKNPTSMFQKMLDGFPRFIRWWTKMSGQKYLDLGKVMPNPHYLFAPDCMEKDGKYYLYFCMADNTEGVAVSDQPEGPFAEISQMPCAGIDPAVFQDDDGKIYYYWGQFRARGVELKGDMRSFREKDVVSNIVTEEEHGFHEGSSVRKRNGIYYYVYPCIYRDQKPTCLAYATSERPLGPFTYRGILIDNSKCDPKSWNIHGSIEEFGGQWYVFYHRSSRNSNVHRRLCAEKIRFHEDGTIDEVKMTSIGAGEPFERGEVIEGWRACEVYDGAYTEGEDLILTPGSGALIRYIRTEEPIAGIKADFEGEGELTFTIAGREAKQAEPGIHELMIHCSGQGVLHSLVWN